VSENKELFEFILYKTTVLESWLRTLCRINHEKRNVCCTFPRCWTSHSTKFTEKSQCYSSEADGVSTQIVAVVSLTKVFGSE
jgi:hypothetical protein